MSVGPWQVLIILLVVLLLFGGNRLGDIGKGLGEGIKNFKKGIADDGPKQTPRHTDAQVVGEKPGADKAVGEQAVGSQAKSDAATPESASSKQSES